MCVSEREGGSVCVPSVCCFSIWVREGCVCECVCGVCQCAFVCVVCKYPCVCGVCQCALVCVVCKYPHVCVGV